MLGGEKSSALIRMRATFPSIRRRVFHAEREETERFRRGNEWSSIAIASPRRNNGSFFSRNGRVSEIDASLARRDAAITSSRRFLGTGSLSLAIATPSPPAILLEDSGARALRCSVPSCGLFVRKLHHGFV